MQSIKFEDLNPNAQEILRGLESTHQDKVKPDDKQIPLFYRNIDDKAVFIEGFLLSWAAYKAFEAIGKDYRIYRGGAGVVVDGPDGTLTVTDERTFTYKLFPIGITISIFEAHNLIYTALREFLEEIFLFSKDLRYRFLPGDLEEFPFVDSLCTFSSSLNVKFKSVKYVGKLKFMRSYFNDMNSAYEELYYWDVRDLENFSAVCQEDWWAGGNSAIPVMAYNLDGNQIKIYTGQQGAQNLEDYKLHPAMPSAEELIRMQA